MTMTDLLRRISVEASKPIMDNRPSVRKDGKALVPDTTPMTNTIRWGVGWTKLDMKRMYLEKGLAFKIINKYTNDCFNHWFDIHSDNKELIDAIKSVNSAPSKYGEPTKYPQLDLKRIFRKSGLMSYKYGYCPIFIGFGETEGSQQDLAKPIETPSAANPVMLLQAIPAINVTKIDIDQSISSDHFGDIESYRVRNKGSSPIIHSSRVLHNQVFSDDNAVEGIPILGPAFNYLDIWEDFIWAVGKGFFRFGMGFPYKQINAEVWSTMDEEDREREANLMKNINVLTGFVGPDNETITFPGVAGSAVNPTPYEEAILDAIAMSIGMPRTVLRGLVTGAITGSEVDEREWANIIKGIQELVYTPLLQEFYKLLQLTKQIPDGEFTIDWNSIIHDTDKQTAEIRKINAETRFIEQKTGLITKETEEDIANGNLVVVDPLQTNTNPFGADMKDAHTEVQTLIFSKERFEDKARVIEWINNNSQYKMTKGIEETDKEFLVWQRDMEDFLDVPIKTVTLTDGISAIVGVLKDPNEDPFFFFEK